MNTPMTVYYDGACPLCRREIDFYRRRRGAECVAWVDVSAAQADHVAPGLCRSDALARFHVRTGDGELMSGARAFAALWAGLPEFRWLGRMAGTRLAQPVLEAAYRRFLRWRPAMQRLVARRGPVEIVQDGRVVDPGGFRDPLRVRARDRGDEVARVDD